MIVPHSLHPLPAQVSCEAFSFRPWLPFPPHLLCQNPASGPKELLLTEVLLCVRPVLNTYILHHLLSMRPYDVGLIKDESLPEVRAGQWRSKPRISGIIPELTDVELESREATMPCSSSPGCLT